MKNATGLENSVLAEHVKPTGQRRSVRRALLNPVVCSIAAALGIFGGISSLVAGVMCIVIHSVVSGDRAFDQVGTTLLILGIPMLLLGSIFLDEIEVKER